MKTIKKIALLTVTALFLLTASCSSNKKDENPCVDGENITLVASAYSDAYQAYYTNASSENCAALKSAGNDYIDLLKSMLDCTQASELQTLRDAITETETALNNAC